jgi:hypothetical protein
MLVVLIYGKLDRLSFIIKWYFCSTHYLDYLNKNTASIKKKIKRTPHLVLCNQMYELGSDVYITENFGTNPG